MPLAPLGFNFETSVDLKIEFLLIGMHAEMRGVGPELVLPLGGLVIAFTWMVGTDDVSHHIPRVYMHFKL